MWKQKKKISKLSISNRGKLIDYDWSSSLVVVTIFWRFEFLMIEKKTNFCDYAPSTNISWWSHTRRWSWSLICLVVIFGERDKHIYYDYWNFENQQQISCLLFQTKQIKKKIHLNVKRFQHHHHQIRKMRRVQCTCANRKNKESCIQRVRVFIMSLVLFFPNTHTLTAVVRHLDRHRQNSYVLCDISVQFFFCNIQISFLFFFLFSLDILQQILKGKNSLICVCVFFF